MPLFCATHPIKIVHVVAKDRQNCIGKDNDLAWHIPADLKHFKEITTGGVIVMGRKTFESLGRPLPNRTHHVITRDTAWTADGVAVAHDLATAINNAKADAVQLGKDRIFIIGGGEIYRQSLSMADVLEITEVDLDVQGDTHYPTVTDDFCEVWRSDRQIDDKSGIGFEFVRYEKSV
ncbi:MULTISPECIES: dihydrofolate reductase [Moraxella]|uniref:Dihydrofolate reductase n=1 Tax=Moraxella lacunata TaxID=477 RepID=A0A1B8Q767_MORLA|nr:MULTISPECIES: dihydrofolate reductase [Moraxella]MBE9578983.1 dihydrofolate reductase [Moraxella sp. K1664]MBE9588328.1 dihydrofolate reductase [Moraxella sp. K1630]MBE9591387.1 dihydrofolate reductase [Moraxella sp. K127]MBE9596461.1 dihydrofolate reductase [Moraxella sp. K2450]MDH9218849.1 dihydrofolate reductase [Moraxella lacunata]